jgi:hypothetical protein
MMLRRVDLVRTDVSEEIIASITRVTRIGELRSPLVITSNRSKLRRNTIVIMEAIRSSETSVLTKSTWGHIPEVGFFPSPHRENLKSYMALTGWAL